MIGFLCVASILLANSSSDGPIPRHDSSYDRPFTHSLSGMSFLFDKGIKLLNNPEVYVRCNGKKIADANKVEVSNYKHEDEVEGTLTAYFDKMYLPKGKNYEVVVAPGSIVYEDSLVPNKEFYRTLKIPNTLGEGRTHSSKDTIRYITNGIYEKFPTFFWGIETKAVGNPEFILYRENIPVRKFPAFVIYDWNLGQAYPKTDLLESKSGSSWPNKILMTFEKGVEYSLVLPAGSVSSNWRNDIQNETSVYTFIGGYEGVTPPLMYTDSVISISPLRKLERLNLIFTRSVSIAPGAKCQLLENDGEKVLKKVNLTVNENEEEQRWNVSADFGGYKLKSGIKYTLVVPEGSITANTGNPLVNKSYTFPIQ